MADFNYTYELYMHPEINPFLLYEWMDEDSFQPIFAELLHLGQLFIFEQDNEKAGMFKLIELQHRTSHIIYLGGVAIHPSHAGKGYGYLMMLEIIEYAKQLGKKRIELSVAVNNAAAIRLYEKAGYVKEGVLRNYSWLEKENRWVDEAIYSVLL